MKITNHINQLLHRNRSVDGVWCTYLFFVLLRIVLVFIPQKGYVHPDEFFQSVEVVAGDHFQIEHIRTWEFNNTMPLRSITLNFFLLRIPWSFLEFIALYIRKYSGIELLQSYTYLVFPRFIMCLISFINDWSMYKICHLYHLRHEIRLLALGSSWVILIISTRTFSNCIEMALCSLMLYLVAECMIRTNTIVYKKEILEERYEKAESIVDRVKIWKLKSNLPSHNFTYLFLLSTICVAGVFNRPTFLLFGAPMVFYWMLRGMGTKTITFFDFNLRMLYFCGCSIPAFILFIFCDSLYYKHLTVGEIHMLDIGINNFIFIPWNFIKYNLDSNKTAEHGLHPKYIHLLLNIPLLYNILGIIALVTFAQLMIRFFRAEYEGLPRAQSIISLMSSAIFVPLFFLSLINHQEARFLLPLTFPIIMLHAPKLMTGFCVSYPFKEEHDILRNLYNNILCSSVSSKYILKIWYIFNIALSVFFGFIHQAGVFPLAQYMENSMKTKSPTEHINLITSHVYNLPVSFLNIPSTQMLLTHHQTGQKYRRQKDFFLYEYGSMDLEHLIGKIQLILSHCEMKLSTKQQRYRLLLAIPNSLSDELSYAAQKANFTYATMELKYLIYPHLSTEAFPRIYGRHPCDVNPPLLENDNLKGICLKEDLPSFSYSYIAHQFSSFIHQFGLSLYEFELKYGKSQMKKKIKSK